MHGIVGIVFGIVMFSVAYIWIIKKSKIVNKKKVLLLIFLLCIILTGVLGLIPVENLFLYFETPYDVFEYIRRGDVERMVTGNESSLLIYINTQNSSHGYIIIPNIQGRYVIPSLFSVRRVLENHDGDGLFYVYSVLGTGDYYIVGQVIAATDIHIIDSNDDCVKVERIKLAENVYLNRIFSFVYNFNFNYYFLLNGEKVRFEQ